MIRFHNGKILRFCPDAVITGDEVWVDGSDIVYVGPAREYAEGFEREIDLKGDVLMPGLKNAHSHTAMTFLRSLADEKPLDRWLQEDVFPNEAKLSAEYLYYLTKLGIMEYVSGGITAAFDMYYYNDSYVRACTEANFRTVICAALNNFDADPTNIEREYLKFNGCSDLIGFMLGIHAEYTTGPERLRYICELGHKYSAPMFTHLCETKSEVEGCIERYGMTPPVFLDSLGFFDNGGGGFHCVHMSDEDIELFASKHLFAVTNPASNLKLASGIAPLEKMRKKGIRIAIGTDGAASNNALDMFREMYLATALQKAICSDASALPAPEVLKMACVNGAHAMGLEGCDNIAEGKKADLIIVSLGAPNMNPVNNVISNIVYAGKSSDVRLTMINGKIVYENGEYFIGSDPGEILSKSQEFVEGIR